MARDQAKEEEEARCRAREREMQHEKEMAILQKEVAESAGNVTVGSNNGAPKMHRSPRLPCFNEHTDSIDDYLRRFERYAVNQG